MVDKQELAELIDSLELPWEEDHTSRQIIERSLLRRYKAELPMLEIQIHNYPYGLGWNVCVNKEPLAKMETKEDAERKALQLYHEALKIHLGIND